MNIYIFLEHADELHMINIKEERGKEPHKHIPNQFADVNIPNGPPSILSKRSNSQFLA